MFFQVLNNLQVKFLNNLGKTKVPMISQTISILFHPVWSWLLVMKYDYGIIGTGIAGVITNFTVLVFNLIYSYIMQDIRPANVWPDRRSIEGINDYLILGIPSTFMMCLDCWANNLSVFFAGYLGTTKLAAQLVLCNIMVVLYMVGMGLE